MTSLILSFIYLSVASGHMYMSDPAPRNYRGNPFVKNIDYDISSPISLSQFPCKNYAPLESVKTVQAGSSIPVTLTGEAVHDGGNCEFCFTYDQQSWACTKTILGNCMMDTRHYDVPVPADAPNGKVTFSWTWANRSGNREFYQNCADITIVGGQDGGKITGPPMVVANYPGHPTVPEIPDQSIVPGRELYENRGTISVSPGGTNNNASPPPPAPAPPAPAPSSQPAPTSSQPAPAPESSSAPSAQSSPAPEPSIQSSSVKETPSKTQVPSAAESTTQASLTSEKSIANGPTTIPSVPTTTNSVAIAPATSSYATPLAVAPLAVPATPTVSKIKKCKHKSRAH